MRAFLNFYIFTGMSRCFFFLAAVVLMASCSASETNEKKYLEREKAELASGVRYDSLFENIYLDMDHDAFRELSLRKHVAKRFREGGLKSGSWVEFSIPEGMKYPAAMNFYPGFQDSRISEVNAAVYYQSDVKFETPFDADEFFKDVIGLMEKWYGQGFMEIEDPEKSKQSVWVKVDGNRRITVYRDENPTLVNVWFVDMAVVGR